MNLTSALRLLAERRTSQVVVTTMGATREWQELSDSPLDLHYLPSAMGHGPMVALGLALACPQREVIALNGDGSMLMSLGSLVTIAAARACNLTVIVLDNGVYEVTGGQLTAGRVAGVDYAAIARAAGFPTAVGFTELDAWGAAIASFLAAPGPRFAALRVEPVRQDYVPRLRIPLSDCLARLRTTLCAAQ